MTVVDVLMGGAAEGGISPRLDDRAWWKRAPSVQHILTALFLGICGPLIFTHALWIDEAQAFVLARDSHSIGELLWNMRYEGHPPLWHFLLWIITRFTTSIWGMQALHLAMAAGSVYLVTRFAPFPLLARILFPFGYFPLFEYGVISRNYQMVMLLAFAFCALWQRRRTSYAWLGLFLGLMCLSHAMGVIIAAGLGVMLLADALVTAEGRGAIRKRPLIFVLGLVLAGMCAAASVMLLKPPPDSGYGQFHVRNETVVNGRQINEMRDYDWYPRWDYRHAQEALSSLADGLLPIVKRQVHFWDSNLTDLSPGATAEGVIIAAVALVCFGWAWRAWLFYGIAALGLVSFSYLKFQGGTRHHGSLFIALMAGFWIAWTWRDPVKPRSVRIAETIPRRLLIVYLAVHVYSATVACYFAWQVPFAAGQAAALAIQKSQQPGDLLVADMEFVAPTLSAYLPGQTFYLAGTDRMGNFIQWRNVDPGKALVTRASELSGDYPAALSYAKQQNKPVIWVTKYQKPVDSNAHFLGSFDGGGNTVKDAKAIMPMETFVVYRIVP